MSALDHIRAYLKAHFANHDIETLMTHLETAIEAKVETAVAEVRQEIASLRDDLTAGRDKPDPSLAPVDLASDTNKPAPPPETEPGSAA